jgi:hypothetical protein
MRMYIYQSNPTLLRADCGPTLKDGHGHKPKERVGCALLK